jgi:hypothetical protein
LLQEAQLFTSRYEKMTVRDLTFTRDSLLACYFKILLKAFVSYGGIVYIAENSGAQF